MVFCVRTARVRSSAPLSTRSSAMKVAPTIGLFCVAAWFGPSAISGAEPSAPPPVASGLHVAATDGAALAIEITPWIDGVERIRGLGVCGAGVSDPEQAIPFVIEGFYRPTGGQRLSGVMYFPTSD